MRLLQRSLVSFVSPQTEGVDIIQRDLFHLTDRRFDIPRHRQIDQDHRMRKGKSVQKLSADRIVGTGSGADYKIAGREQFHPIPVIDPFASLRNIDDAAPVLTHSDSHISPCPLQGQRGQPPHLSVSDHHTGFSPQAVTCIRKHGNGPVHGGVVCVGEDYLGLDPLRRRHCASEQHLQHIVRAVIFSGKRQRLPHLCQDLILRQDHGFQSAGQRKQMFHRFLSFPFYKIPVVLKRRQPFVMAQPDEKILPAFLCGARPQFHAVAGGKQDTALDAFQFFELFHRLRSAFFGKRKLRSDIQSCQAVVNSNHPDTHLFFMLLFPYSFL